MKTIIQRTILKTVILICAALYIWLRLAMGAETLTFDASPSPQVGYVLRWGTNPPSIIGELALDTNRVVELTNGPWGSYYFKVFAVASNGTNSLPSNVLLATNLPAAPLQLRIVPSTNVVYLEGTTDLQTWRQLAVIVQDSQPVILAALPQQLFRASTAGPPLPGADTAAGAPVSKPARTAPILKPHKQRGVR